jgi:hypothetical protein
VCNGTGKHVKLFVLVFELLLLSEEISDVTKNDNVAGQFVAIFERRNAYRIVVVTLRSRYDPSSAVSPFLLRIRKDIRKGREHHLELVGYSATIRSDGRYLDSRAVVIDDMTVCIKYDNPVFGDFEDSVLHKAA